jgi:hypothetical protein
MSTKESTKFWLVLALVAVWCLLLWFWATTKNGIVRNVVLIVVCITAGYVLEKIDAYFRRLYENAEQARRNSENILRLVESIEKRLSEIETRR